MKLILTALTIAELVVQFFLWIHHNLETSQTFSERWPPIDEDEFLRRCHPGVNRDIALRVRAIVADQLGFPCEQIYPEQNFVYDLDCL